MVVLLGKNFQGCTWKCNGRRRCRPKRHQNTPKPRDAQEGTKRSKRGRQKGLKFQLDSRRHPTVDGRARPTIADRSLFKGCQANNTYCQWAVDDRDMDRKNGDGSLVSKHDDQLVRNVFKCLSSHASFMNHLIPSEAKVDLHCFEHENLHDDSFMEPKVVESWSTCVVFDVLHARIEGKPIEIVLSWLLSQLLDVLACVTGSHHIDA
ncbi:hypothetical protein M9H77_26852 [Catharanthus roseus]|uniref:Uncharacterized protein n=1 Tax=Catharanthus roseus TaxID=4058 RepID=A0ACC0AB78_CATRO|nr:hypothetical protein M9H77_26852 [Catharanthus roseus]